MYSTCRNRGCGTYSHACSYGSPADLWPHKLSDPQEGHSADSSAGAFPDPFTFITLHPSNPPTYNAALWQKLLRNFSVILVFLFSFHRFWGSVRWWWHPVTETNMSSVWWWMIVTLLNTFPNIIFSVWKANQPFTV